jgi:hypothetical protein
MKLPQPWATSDNYSTGPDVGTPTKVDPSSSADGFIRGTAAAAQHVNHNFHPLAETTRRVFTTTSLALRLLDDQQDDLTAGLGAAQVAVSVPVVLIKASTTGVLRVMGAGADAGGAIAGFTDSVKQAARVGSTVVVVGSGGTENCRTSDNGVGWTAGGATGLLTEPVSVAGNGTQFCLVSSAGGSAHGTGATWTGGTIGDDVSDVVTGGGITSVAGITGVFVAVGLEAGDPAFARSTDNGVTWTAGAGTVPNAAAQSDAGYVTSDGATTFYHAGRRASTTCDVAVSTTGSTWTTIATLTSALTISGVKIMHCDRTDLLVVAMQHTTNTEVRASTDGGLTWSEPEYLQGFVLAGLAVAGGRLFASKGAKLFASDGVGAE